jgi:hypothetical protein
VGSRERYWPRVRRAAESRGIATVEEYRRYIADLASAWQVCSPEERAGGYATVCPACGRRTVHQRARVFMACGREEVRCE